MDIIFHLEYIVEHRHKYLTVRNHGGIIIFTATTITTAVNKWLYWSIQGFVVLAGNIGVTRVTRYTTLEV